ncbi:MAG: MobF family relaxase [Cytophagales bacterium]|nr:MobF family relaxase [Cytophagales bacterium]
MSILKLRENRSAMLRITQIANAKAASSYHRSSLSRQGEYYMERVEAVYQGKLAQIIGLSEVTAENYDLLASNKRPGTKDRLTALDSPDRRVGWDLTTLPPKSFSILCALSDDPDLDEVFKSSNREMMLEAEQLVFTQANTQKNRSFEETGNACWAEFHHRVGRPVEYKRGNETLWAGQPLEHYHNVLFSASQSPSRNKILAIDPFHIFKSAQFLQSYLHTKMCNRLMALGYKIERTEDAWEIMGVSHLNERFSDRSKIINEIAKDKGITADREKSQLGARSRVSKNKAIPESEHYPLWKSQLSKEEFESLKNVKDLKGTVEKTVSLSESIDRSLEHFLERNSTAETHRILGHAMSLSYGSGHDPSDFQKELESRKDVLWGEEKGISILTTKDVVRSEDEMHHSAISGKGKMRALNPDHQIQREFLNDGQTKAVLGALQSKDAIMAWEGMAGSGKTTTLMEYADGLKAVNKKVIPLSQSSQSVEVLRKEGFADAMTIASFLMNPESQTQAHGNVIVVDEASFLGVPTANEIFNVARDQEARVLLTGNVRQHLNPGEHGDALKLLQRSQIKTFHISENMRQLDSDYRKAVDFIARKNMAAGFKIIDQKLNAINEVPDRNERLEQLSDAYLKSLLAKRKALIVTTTNHEKDEITEIVRDKLKAQGHLKGEERCFPTLKNLNLTESQKKDPHQYQEGRVIRFWKNQKAPSGKGSGFKAGSHYEVKSKDKNGAITVEEFKSKQELTLNLDQAHYFTLHQKSELSLMVGDHIKPTVNLKSEQDTKLNNGTPQVVSGFDKGGNILLQNGKTLAKDSYHIDHNIASTTYAAQGKTSQDVYLSLSDASLSALTDRSFYVAVSRGRSRLQIFTDSKKELQRAIYRSGDQRSAHSVAAEHYRRLEEQKRRDHHKYMNKDIEHAISTQRQKQAQRDISRATQVARDR